MAAGKDHIADVLSVGAHAEMGWVDAQALMALMTYFETRWDLSHEPSVIYARCAVDSRTVPVTYADLSIPLVVDGPGPKPATGVRLRLCILVDALYE